MTTYYKAVKPNGTDFRTGRVLYAVGETVTHPEPHKRDASGYLSVATVPTDCTGASWPLRLFEVSADEVWECSTYPNKRCTHSLTVVREIDPWLALGPQGPLLVALVERAGQITADEARRLAATRYAAGDAAWAAARAAAWDAARDAAWAAARAAAWDAAWYAAWDAARAALVRDLIGQHGFTQEMYDLLTGPWRKIIGPVHPDDIDLRTVTA